MYKKQDAYEMLVELQSKIACHGQHVQKLSSSIIPRAVFHYQGIVDGPKKQGYYSRGKTQGICT